ncbi:MAG: thioredoxin family protein [Paraburkholderia sp.]|jgi:thiol-disulfide isomerase/thioredoxin|nr:thioredoxin family protein [Paraburkholderia sp.]
MFNRIRTLSAAAVAATTLIAAAATFCNSAQAETIATSATAPEFTGIDKWLNSAPLTMQQLRGKVVLVDFWTYSCINCIHTLPYVKDWYAKYKDQGLTVIGVHTPEYPFERDTDNVKTAIRHFGIRYPVAQDNSYATWNAYGNEYWPALYLIDKRGHIVYSHFGEGDYAQTEAAIQHALAGKS